MDARLRVLEDAFAPRGDDIHATTAISREVVWVSDRIALVVATWLAVGCSPIRTVQMAFRPHQPVKRKCIESSSIYAEPE